MKTNYGFIGNYRRYGGIIIIFIFSLIVYIQYGKSHITDIPDFWIFPIGWMITIIFYWYQPHVDITRNGLKITRFFYISRELKWSEIFLNKKISRNPSYRFMGLDPRYAKIIIKDAVFPRNRFYITAFIEDYDQLIGVIELKTSAIEEKKAQ
jgi:hypothetical protein